MSLDGPTFPPGSQPRPAPPRLETELSRRARYVWAGRVGALLLRAWGRTWTLRWDLPDSVRRLEREGEHLVYAFWHQHILALAYAYRWRRIVVMVSQHGDGESIAQIIHRLGFGTVRGSTTRGGTRAALELARLGRAGHPLGISPDGPRGPRQVCQPGGVLVAQRSGLPLVPLAVGMRGGRRLDSWDRFEVPGIGARLLITAGEPVLVSPDLEARRAVEVWQPRIQSALDAVEARAQDWEGRATPRRKERP